MTDHQQIEQESIIPAMPLDRPGANFLLTLLPTLGKMLFTPQKAFNPNEHVAPWRALTFVILMSILSMLLESFFALFSFRNIHSLLFLIRNFGVALIWAPLVTMLIIIPASLFAHYCLKIFKTEEATLARTMRVLCYAWGSYILLEGLITNHLVQYWHLPKFLNYISSIWLAVMVGFGLFTFYGKTIWKPFYVWVLLAAIYLVIHEIGYLYYFQLHSIIIPLSEAGWFGPKPIMMAP